MTDATKQTSRFSFQKIGDGVIGATAGQTAVAGSGNAAQELEPRDYNAILQTLDNNLTPTGAVSTFTAGTGVAITSNVGGPGTTLRLTLTNALVTVTNANNYGSLKILTWPNTNLAVLSARFNLTCVKDGTGLLATDTPHVAVGSAAASNKTLATTMVDTVEQVTLAGTLSAAAQQNGPHTAGNRYIAAGASNYLYLNAGVSANGGGVDGTLTVSGTVDIFFDDYGVYS